MRLAALALSVTVLLSQSNEQGLAKTPAKRSVPQTVTAVRIAAIPGGTRVTIDVTGAFEFKYDRLHDPDRVYFDVKGASPRIEGKRIWHQELSDKLVQRVRVAETSPGVTRVVLDVAGPVDVAPSVVTVPSRLTIDLRPSSAPLLSDTRTQPAAPQVTTTPPSVNAEMPRAEKPHADATAEPGNFDIRPEPTKPEPVRPAPPVNAEPPARVEAAKAAPLEAAREPVKAAIMKTEAKTDAKTVSSGTRAETAKAARPTSFGSNSLTRALGLKLTRVVLDAGHGGHDQGTSGAKGLLEKELVLDVTMRLGKLIEHGLGAEVIYTRTDDTFIPLEGRPAIANQNKADLFVSIHANSSPVSRITGVETYYLNFSDSKEAMDLASRENASSRLTISDLESLTHKITLHEKLDESRDLAAKVQGALFAFSARSFPAQKNRGVKKAPFVVLIGAQMPSILAEIGFVTNPREEQLLKRPDYRQKLAESLYKGISRYADSLSHYQLAQKD